MNINDMVYDDLKSTCGAKCIDDPENCKCFGEWDKIRIDSVDGDYDPETDIISSKEECSYYDRQLHFFNKDKKIFDEMIINLSDGEFSDSDLKNIIKICWEKDCNGEDFTVFLGLYKTLGRAKGIKKEKKDQYIYFLHSDHGMKIGRSNNPYVRSRTIGTKTPFKITKREIFKVKDMSIAEKGLHKHFKQYRLNGEWFNLSGHQIEEARQIIDKQYHEIKDTLKPLFDVKEIK